MHQPNHGREKIPIVIAPELFPRDGERRARQSSRHNVDAFEFGGVKFLEVFFKHPPFRPVQTEGGARVLVDFHEAGMLNARLLKS
jgi:hypothetical protein